MKKYIVFASALIAVAAVAITGCRKIETDGEKEIVIITQPGSGGTTGQTITLQGRINADTILRKENTYILKGLVYMVGNHTMTIQPGTVIKGAFSGSDVAALTITRGSKIVARGSATEPIVFTTSSPNPQSGDWGGIIICGKAGINASFNGVQGLYQVEGGVDNANGDGLAGSGDAVAPTPVDTDSSGVLSYVRIEYAGYAFQPDKEINSLTLAAVGSKTVIDHVETLYAKDDAFEWFGGSVNCKYLIAAKTQDDDFDTDNGYNGKVQFGLVIRDSVIADISTSEAFESDNNASGTTATPQTSAVFCNITAIGPRATLNNVGSTLFRAGAQIRRNSTISILNSVIMGWPQGVLIDASTGTPTDNNITSNNLRIKYTTLAGNTVNVKYTASSSAPTGATDASITAWFTDPANGNTILTNCSDAKLIQPFNYAAVDPTPFAGSNGYAPIVSGANFTDSKVTDPFFTVVTYRGAIAPAGPESTWWKGWTKF
ncbi:hypothetical protein ACFOWM_10230 [Ferruginibacter yonginensis]|uniref:DUF5689 domain-containing protein n=1 Tax=Ferruginibacter yonginensis TaxID=1310416 RepID=A0ABV8QSH3_9BACT